MYKFVKRKKEKLNYQSNCYLCSLKSQIGLYNLSKGQENNHRNTLTGTRYVKVLRASVLKNFDDLKYNLK